MNLSLLGANLAKFQFWWFSGLFWQFFPCKNWFFSNPFQQFKKKIGRNKSHPQFLYHINQWKTLGTFCYFQPCLICNLPVMPPKQTAQKQGCYFRWKPFLSAFFGFKVCICHSCCYIQISWNESHCNFNWNLNIPLCTI